MSLVAVRHLKYLWLGLNSRNDKCGFLKEKKSVVFLFSTEKIGSSTLALNKSYFSVCLVERKSEWRENDKLKPQILLLAYSGGKKNNYYEEEESYKYIRLQITQKIIL